MSFAARMITVATDAPPVVQLPTSQSVTAYASGATLSFGGAPSSSQYVYTTGINIPSGPKYTFTSYYTWLLSGSASDYDARFTLTSGSLASGTVGTWINIGFSLPGWTSNSGISASGTLEIRNASTLAVLASCPVTFATV